MHSYRVIKKAPLTAEKIELQGCKLHNFYRIGEGVYRSDQPSAACFVALEKYGIREVLNLRSRHNDRKEAKGTHLRLHRLRTRASRMNLNDMIEAMRIIRDRQGPLLFHCWHGSDRTGAVAALYRMVFQGVDKEEALYEMTEGIFGFHMIFDSIIDVIAEAHIPGIRKRLKLVFDPEQHVFVYSRH